MIYSSSFFICRYTNTYYYHYHHQYQYQYQYHHHLVAICSYPTINSCDYGPNSITSL